LCYYSSGARRLDSRQLEVNIDFTGFKDYTRAF
jgi:hypothetical protein